MSGGFSPVLKREDVGLSGQASFLASEHYMVKRGGITLDSSLVPANENGDKILQAGQFVAEQASTGKYAPYGGLTNEIQTVTISGSPTGGTFTLTFDGQTTEPIAYNASAAALRSALEGLPNLDEGDVKVTKSGSVYTVTFGGEYTGENVSLMTDDPAGLTGGTTPNATEVQVTAGGGAIADLADPSDDTSGYLLEAVNLKDGDVICGLLIHGSVLSARVNPTPDATIKAAVKGRIIFQ